MNDESISHRLIFDHHKGLHMRCLVPAWWRSRLHSMATKKSLTALAPALHQTFSMQARNSTVRIECSDPNLLLSVICSRAMDHRGSTSPPSPAGACAGAVARRSSPVIHDQASGETAWNALAANASWQRKLREAQRISPVATTVTGEAVTRGSSPATRDQASGNTVCLHACETAAACSCIGGSLRHRAQP